VAEVYEVLERALALIEDEQDWCQGKFSREKRVGLLRRKRTQRCALGAIRSSASLEADGMPWADFLALPEIRPLQAIVLEKGYDQVGTFNNASAHAEVVALFQKAIRAEKQKAGIPLDLPADERKEDRKAVKV
jgi:hypothetical protein